jgi:hypothetical protein
MNDLRFALRQLRKSRFTQRNATRPEVLIPARHAIKVDPMVALRAE